MSKRIWIFAIVMCLSVSTSKFLAAQDFVVVSMKGDAANPDDRILMWDEAQPGWINISPASGTEFSDNDMPVYSMCVFQGKLYVGANNAKVYRYLGQESGRGLWEETGELDVLSSTGQQQVWSLSVAGNELYAGTNQPSGYAAFCRYDLVNNKWTRISYTTGYYAESDIELTDVPGNDLLLRGVASIDEHRDPTTGQYGIYLGDSGSDLIRRYDGGLMNYELNIPWIPGSPEGYGCCIWDYQEYDGVYYAISEWGRFYVRVENSLDFPDENKQWHLALEYENPPDYWVDKPVYHLAVWRHPDTQEEEFYAAIRNRLYKVNTQNPYELELDPIGDGFDYEGDGYPGYDKTDKNRLDSRDERDHITSMVTTDEYIYLSTQEGFMYVYDGDVIKPLPSDGGGPNGEGAVRCTLNGDFNKIQLDVVEFSHKVDRVRITEASTDLTYTITYKFKGPSNRIEIEGLWVRPLLNTLLSPNTR